MDAALALLPPAAATLNNAAATLAAAAASTRERRNFDCIDIVTSKFARVCARGHVHAA
jgi:hypothetical protein